MSLNRAIMLPAASYDLCRLKRVQEHSSRVSVHVGCDIVYWRVKFPWPLSDRDYVYYRRLLVDADEGRCAHPPFIV